jgi:hypothetical protein
MSESKAVLARALPSEEEESEAKPSEIPNFRERMKRKSPHFLF